MNPQKTFLLIKQTVVLFLSLILLNHCHSSDLGKQPPDRVAVDIALTSWDGGAGKVIATKCANCHTAQRHSFVPANTPTTLDGIETLEFFRNNENIGLARAMRKRIESDDSAKQMPPRFATPLYDDEKIVVLNFLRDVEKNATGGSIPDCPKPTNSFAVNSHDDDDDDDDHPTPKPPSPPVTTPTPGQESGTNPCGDNPGNPVPKVTFNDIALIIAKTCGGCHNGTNEFRLATREDFVNKKPLPLNEIQAGSMPRRNPTWKTTVEAQLVIQWLSGPQTE